MGGWDKHLGFQLYQGDPSGNYGGWKATSIGGSSQSATSMLEQDYDESMDLEKAINLAMGIYLKTLDTQTLNAEKIEVSLIKRVNGTVQYTVMKPADVNKYCKKAEEEKKKKAEEEEKRKKLPLQRSKLPSCLFFCSGLFKKLFLLLGLHRAIILHVFTDTIFVT